MQERFRELDERLRTLELDLHRLRRISASPQHHDEGRVWAQLKIATISLAVDGIRVRARRLRQTPVPRHPRSDA